MLTVTDRAKQKFLEVVRAEGREGHGLRVIVQGGGTAQPQFALNFVSPEESVDGDTVIDVGEFKIYVENDSAKYVEGAEIDFVDELNRSGFKVEAPNAGVPRPSGPVADAVQRALDEKINPGVAMHGGHVDLVAVEEGTVYLRFGGGCQGCGMVNVTLKQGVEKVLLADVPQVTKVMDVTDHASGTNPYYQPAK
jgi:Fe/S biogenesis protein NfuA